MIWCNFVLGYVQFSLWLPNFCLNVKNFVTSWFSGLENMVVDTKYRFLSFVVSEISSFLALHMAGLAAILDLVPEEVSHPCASRYFLVLHLTCPSITSEQFLIYMYDVWDFVCLADYQEKFSIYEQLIKLWYNLLTTISIKMTSQYEAYLRSVLPKVSSFVVFCLLLWPRPFLIW